MPENLLQLPATAKFMIGQRNIAIRDHRVLQIDGLFGRILSIINDSNSNMETLLEFEGHKINFETAIEECAYELQVHAQILMDVIWWHYDSASEHDACLDFSAGDRGRMIADIFIEKIRSCDDWQDLYEEMQLTSKFNRDMRNMVETELEQQCPKV